MTRAHRDLVVTDVRVQVVRTFLRLLFEEAALEAFEEPLRAAAAQGAGEDELERLRGDMVLALQIRATLAERRRRESELAALNETAADLTAIRDLDLVLQAIVRRARSLLGTDTSYLTLIDEERGDTVMQVTEGITSAAFKRLRLELGRGLGGLVAQTRHPYASPSYARDDRFDHTGTIDAAVTEEGLIAILGVPILLGGEVIGVLFAADRLERSFSPQEVALLSAFAAHAAVAIENARLFQESEEALEELNAANALVSEHSQAVERAAAAHERLTGIVLAGGGVPEVAAAVADLFTGSLAVVDPDGRVVGLGGAAREDWLTDGIHSQVDEARTSSRTVRAVDDAGRACWIAPVLASTQHLGALVLWPAHELTGADLRTLERAAQVTALQLLNQRSIAEAELAVRGELLVDLVRGGGDGEATHQRALLLGTDLGQAHCVAVGMATNTSLHRTWSAASALAREAGGLAGIHQSEVVLMLPGEDPRTIAELAQHRLSSVLDDEVTVGGAGPTSGPIDVPAAYEEATRCRRVLQALGRDGSAATSADLGAYSLLLGGLQADELGHFIHRTIGPLIAYDTERRTELGATLEAFFAHAGSLARTSEALHIHVNTLYQRLDRVAQLLGPDWQEPDRALHVHLALRLDRLRRAE
jgi:sugar diacid utilization regulator